MQISEKNHRKRHFYVIHQNDSQLRSSHNISSTSNNIFNGMEPVDDYFPTCPAEILLRLSKSKTRRNSLRC